MYHLKFQAVVGHWENIRVINDCMLFPYLGGRIAGKAAVEDFCFSASSVSPQTGTVTNPVNPLYSAGGSSCGSAALVSGS